MYFTTAGADLIGNQEQLKLTVEAASAALGVPVTLVVLDTLAANFGGGDENSASDMAYAIANAKSAAPGAALLFVHHMGHGMEQRERGSSALASGADYRLRASYDETTRIIELEFLKEKDDDRHVPMLFDWPKVPLGWEDANGEELTSIVVDLLPDSSRPAPKLAGLGDQQELMLRTLTNLYARQRKNLEDQGRDPNEAKVFITGFRGTMVNSKKMDRRRFSDGMKALAERRLIVIDEPFVMLGEVTP